MPKTSRLIINDEAAIYHVMSRTAVDGFPLGDIEKDFMIDLIKRYSGLYFVEILFNRVNGKPLPSASENASPIQV